MTDQPVFSRRFDYEDRTKLADSAYEELKEAIVNVRFRPGDVLRESTVARQLGVSKTPVREALLKLEQEGLVELIPFKGAVVSGYSPEDVREVFEMRALLEGASARRVADSADPGVIGKLQENVSASQDAFEAGDLGTVVECFDAFDDMLFTQMANRRLRSLLENLQLHLRRIGKLSTEIPGRLESSIEQHREVVEALVASDPDAAEKLMRTHIESVLEDQIAYMTAEKSPNRRDRMTSHTS